MKVKTLFMGVAFAAILVSCTTFSGNVTDVTTKNIPNPSVTIAPLTPADYTVLGPVSGTGKVTFDGKNGKYIGDTLKYGNLGAGGDSEIGRVYNTTTTGLWGLSTHTTTTVVTPANSREMAIGNAAYAMIEQARSMGADAIIFVTQSVEASGDPKAQTTTTSATLNGIAIKLK